MRGISKIFCKLEGMLAAAEVGWLLPSTPLKQHTEIHTSRHAPWPTLVELYCVLSCKPASIPTLPFSCGWALTSLHHCLLIRATLFRIFISCKGKSFSISACLNSTHHTQKKTHTVILIITLGDIQTNSHEELKSISRKHPEKVLPRTGCIINTQLRFL